MCYLLIRFGSDLNHKDLSRKLCLHYAVQQKAHQVTILLIANGSSIFSSLKVTSDEELMQEILLKGKQF